jgi:hypothetical protein
VIKSKKVRSVSRKMRQLTRNVRLVFDYLRMTKKLVHPSQTLRRGEQIYRVSNPKKLGNQV